jgi:hypothetical protein
LLWHAHHTQQVPQRPTVRQTHHTAGLTLNENALLYRNTICTRAGKRICTSCTAISRAAHRLMLAHVTLVEVTKSICRNTICMLSISCAGTPSAHWSVRWHRNTIYNTVETREEIKTINREVPQAQSALRARLASTTRPKCTKVVWKRHHRVWHRHHTLLKCCGKDITARVEKTSHVHKACK